MTTTLPKITSLGIQLDSSEETLGWLQDSSEIASDADSLRARMSEEGYLFLPGYLDRDEVLAARRELLERMSKNGDIDLNHPLMDGVLSKGARTGFAPHLALENPPLMKVLYDGAMMDFFRLFLGEPVRHFDYTWLRTVGTGRATAPHMDAVYMSRGSSNLWTAWTPLGDIPIEMGGLMILEKGHSHERLNNNYGRKDVDKFCANRRDEGYTGMGGGGNIRGGGMLTGQPAKLRANLGGRWLTCPEYRAGDLLVFSILTIHAGIDNTTDRIRLSSDSRYQPAADPADERWIGDNPIAHGPAAKRAMIC